MRDTDEKSRDDQSHERSADQRSQNGKRSQNGQRSKSGQQAQNRQRSRNDQDFNDNEREINERAMNEMSNTWKQQVDGFVRVVQAFAEGSMRLREAQMRAMSGARDSLEEGRRLLERTVQSQEVWRSQSEWLADGFERSLRYFNEVTQATAETQSKVARQMFEPVAFAPQTAVLPQASKTAVGMMDDAYRRWRDTALQFYGPEQPFVRKLAEQSREARRAAQEAMEKSAEQFEDLGDEDEGQRGAHEERQNGNRRGRAARAQGETANGRRGRGRRAAGEEQQGRRGQGARKRAKQEA